MTKQEMITIHNSVSTLANVRDADKNEIIDLLTGYLWDEEEAGAIKMFETERSEE
jgi:hypothetical protein